MSSNEYDDNCITLRFTDFKGDIEESEYGSREILPFVRVDHVVRENGSYVHQHVTTNPEFNGGKFPTRKSALLACVRYLNKLIEESLDDDCKYIKGGDDA